MLWDRALGYCYIPLHSIMYEMDDGSNENWVSLDGDLVMQDGEVIATKNPTGHSVLINCHFEQPFATGLPLISISLFPS
ncbi:protein unc-13 homolog A-like [Frankliniella occidentalis]|uniref:Protein unc-13 homolog A-like n=1 Tax=Frankliniella occidentalis TaxID=133901 RepID=A0A9C6U515_FRAOC|nr:protein unc-13 homolog A-like [Frankliniella occidentalis]